MIFGHVNSVIILGYWILLFNSIVSMHKGPGNKTSLINYHKYCNTGHSRRQWGIRKLWKSKWFNSIKSCVCIVELKEHFFPLNTLCACVLVKAAAYSVHALDKLYSILCTFKFKFLTNSKKKNDMIMQVNKTFTLVVLIL